MPSTDTTGPRRTSPRARRAALKAVAGLAAGLGVMIVAGCAAPSPRPPEPGGAVPGAPALWDMGELPLAELNGAPVADRVARVGARTPTLRVEADGRFSGQSGVNRYAGRADAEALGRGAWSPGPIASTRMAGPPGANDLEVEFLAALERAGTVRIDGRRVTLRAGSADVAVFLRP